MNATSKASWCTLMARLVPETTVLSAASLASFIALAAIAFSHYSNALFYRFDGSFILTLATTQRHWMAPGVGFSLNFLEGIGDAWIPIATNWSLGFKVGGLFEPRSMPIVACLIFASEFFLSTLVLARCVGASWTIGLGGAWLGSLSILPFFVPTLADWRIWGNPHFLTAVAATTLSLCAFLTIGRARLARDAGAILTVLAMLSYLVVSFPALAPIAGLFLAIFGCAAIVAAADWHELRHKIVGAAALVIIMGAAYGAYEVALFSYARTAFFWDDLAAFPVAWREQSFLISEGRGYGFAIWVACVAGAALAAKCEEGKLRQAAVAFLCFIAIQQAIFLLNTIVGFKWRGPSAAYLDMFALPFYAVFGSYFALGWLRRTPEGWSRALALVTLAPWPIVLLSLHEPLADRGFREQNPFVWPPRPTPITRFLQTQIGLREGEPFRGRVVSIAGTEFEPQYAAVPLISQHNYDAAVAFFTGNDHRYFGLWYYGIPTLIADNQFASPFAHAMNSRLLARPTEKHVRQLTTLTRYEPRFLAQMGVRFVLTSRPLEDVQPVITLPVASNQPEPWVLYLYEVPQAKVAGFWSTRPQHVATVRQALLSMTSTGPHAADATLYEEVNAGLTEGRSSELRVFRDRLVIEADSFGTSLLVLPLEFSHCFELRMLEGSRAHFLRANINQSALLFLGHLKVELRYRLSPWHFRCRFRDIADARDLGLADVGWPE